MSTVASINKYTEIRGISENISLVSDSQDVEWLKDYIKPDVLDEYGSFMVYCADSEVKLIWGVSTLIPWLTSYCELIYSESQLCKKIANKRKNKK
jgi:hypothetical protein